MSNLFLSKSLEKVFENVKNNHPVLRSAFLGVQPGMTQHHFHQLKEPVQFNLFGIFAETVSTSNLDQKLIPTATISQPSCGHLGHGRVDQTQAARRHCLHTALYSNPVWPIAS